VFSFAFQLYALRRLMQGTELTPKAPLGNNARPLQQLHHRTIRTNIDFNKVGFRFDIKKFYLKLKFFICFSSNRINSRIAHQCTEKCITKLINGHPNYSPSVGATLIQCSTRIRIKTSRKIQPDYIQLTSLEETKII
jgi:hypothetical protein